jgi:hypothetical protein
MNTNSPFAHLHEEIRRHSKIFTLVDDVQMFAQQHIPGYFFIQVRSMQLSCKLYATFLRKIAVRGDAVVLSALDLVENIQHGAEAALEEWKRSHDVRAAQKTYHSVFSQDSGFNTDMVERASKEIVEEGGIVFVETT